MNFLSLALCLHQQPHPGWALMFAYWSFKGHNLIALIYCDDVDRWFWRGLAWGAWGGDSTTSQHKITVFPHAVWSLVKSFAMFVNGSNCAAEFFIVTDTLTSPPNPCTGGSHCGGCACLCVHCAFLFFFFFFCCTLGLMWVIGVLVGWISASTGGQIAYDDHVLTRWLAGTRFRIGGVCMWT